MNDELREKAARIKQINDEIRSMEGQVKELKSERETLSNDVVATMQGMELENGEGLRLDDVGFVKLDAEIFPTILNYNALGEWSKKEGQELPGFTINAKTFGAWWKEQIENGKPLPPEDVVKPFLKQRIKILK